ncbi:uncharacterized protein LOC114246734 [Bombyx mandarina]|uniref:Uncharacterized protein LOC114246734 n=1 Tax=Bombyx mandarina TaxID=7092 RepID=A0A6J2K0L2_BOMMA|nr:uncharacterized protein LOC114246734 [Bombyx mandarina]
MFFSLLALALAGLALYVYTHENTQQSSASILREVWTGKCQLSCCESRDGNAHEAGSSSGPDPCACAPCPCRVLASVYRTCRPAGQAYRRIADTISDCFYIGLIMLAEAFMYIQRVFQFGRSRERQAELVNTNVYESTENFHFNGDEPTEKVSNKTNKNITQHESVSDANRRAIAKDESNVPFNDRDDINEPNIEFGKNEIIGSVINDNIPGFIEASAAKADEESNAVDAGCHKCLEKGKVCMSECPKAKTNKK